MALTLAAAHLVWQTSKVKIDDPTECLATFKYNRVFGLILLCGVIAGTY